jgi:hypothetical protein
MHWLDSVLQAVVAIAVPILTILVRRSNKLLSYNATARTIMGKFGIAAKDAPGATVSETGTKIIHEIEAERNISAEAARNAVLSVQVELGLPTGEAALHTKIDDVWPVPKK